MTKCLKCTAGGKVVNRAGLYGVIRTCQGCGHTWNGLQDREVDVHPPLGVVDVVEPEEPEFSGIRPYVPEAPEDLPEASPPEEDTEAAPKAKRGPKRKPRAKKGS